MFHALRTALLFSLCHVTISYPTRDSKHSTTASTVRQHILHVFQWAPGEFWTKSVFSVHVHFTCALCAAVLSWVSSLIDFAICVRYSSSFYCSFSHQHGPQLLVVDGGGNHRSQRGRGTALPTPCEWYSPFQEPSSHREPELPADLKSDQAKSEPKTSSSGISDAEDSPPDPKSDADGTLQSGGSSEDEIRVRAVISSKVVCKASKKLRRQLDDGRFAESIAFQQRGQVDILLSNEEDAKALLWILRQLHYPERVQVNNSGFPFRPRGLDSLCRILLTLDEQLIDDAGVTNRLQETTDLDVLSDLPISMGPQLIQGLWVAQKLSAEKLFYELPRVAVNNGTRPLAEEQDEGSTTR